ncbi:hypothetical protein FM042_04910 [Aliidiomarina halalkaliphila]|uniref:Uncharacterized protein n=1 Tax=Aliidiomarina halalkaliphila TaxID=2593535 RepID=A0A552X585_9GAMM|nr:hypothetical protein [Aliidiomarina halalkaliphila]TRW50177.1 hypothetical protein FM042_04910 [Aliidiomarina halalkaliphila]
MEGSTFVSRNKVSLIVGAVCALVLAAGLLTLTAESSATEEELAHQCLSEFETFQNENEGIVDIYNEKFTHDFHVELRQGEAARLRSESDTANQRYQDCEADRPRTSASLCQSLQDQYESRVKRYSDYTRETEKMQADFNERMAAFDEVMWSEEWTTRLSEACGPALGDEVSEDVWTEVCPDYEVGYRLFYAYFDQESPCE